MLDSIPFNKLPETEVIVVDNGSTDRTAQVALSRQVRVVKERRRGYGIATMTGLTEAAGDILVTMDADGAHWPGDLPRLLSPLLSGASNVALGVRIHSYPHGMKIRRFLGNVVLARVFDTLYSESLSDVQCGFRAIKRESLKGLRLSQQGMQFAIEFLIELKRRRVPLIPIKVRQLPTKTSHLKEATDFVGHLALMIRRFPTFWATRTARIRVS